MMVPGSHGSSDGVGVGTVLKLGPAAASAATERARKLFKSITNNVLRKIKDSGTDVKSCSVRKPIV